MPQMAIITINDGKTTPVAHVFSPQTTNGTDATFMNRAALTPAGYESLSINVRGPGGSKTAAHRVTGSITLPVMGVVNGQDVVTKVSKFDYAFSLSQASTLQDRKDLRVLAANLLSSAIFASVVENTEPMF